MALKNLDSGIKSLAKAYWPNWTLFSFSQRLTSTFREGWYGCVWVGFVIGRGGYGFLWSVQELFSRALKNLVVMTYNKLHFSGFVAILVLGMEYDSGQQSWFKLVYRLISYLLNVRQEFWWLISENPGIQTNFEVLKTESYPLSWENYPNQLCYTKGLVKMVKKGGKMLKHKSNKLRNI